MAKKLIVVAALLGAMMGASAAVITLNFLQVREDLKWRCIEYSPVNGKCVVLERVDRPRLEEDES